MRGGFMPRVRVRHSPLGLSTAYSGRRGPARLQRAPLVAVLAGSCPPPSLHVLKLRADCDRCGAVVLSWAGPKLLQTRDGRSWRTLPSLSFWPAGPSFCLPHPWVVCG